MAEKIVIPSSEAIIVLESFDNLEIKEDIFELALGAYEAKSKLQEDTNNLDVAKAMADYLNARWSEYLNKSSEPHVISPSYALKILKPVMDKIQLLKKNSESSVM